MNMKLINGDCLEKLKELADNSVDAIVTDPPAGISFMNKEWDSNKGGRDEWMKWLEEVMTEAKRVLKHGGHALVWAIPRTSHWTAMACENAGFEVRDCVYHIQAQGFPKSLNISKAIDKKFGVERVVIGKKTGGAHSAVSGNDGFGQGKYSNAERENSNCDKIKTDNMSTITAPATDLAKTYDGYGSQLKPAVECWWLLRKPLEGSIVDNVLKYGTGGINIDKSRIATEEETRRSVAGYNSKNDMYTKYDAKHTVNQFETRQPQGRFPANLIHDGSDAVMEEFAKYGESKSSIMGFKDGYGNGKYANSKRDNTKCIKDKVEGFVPVGGYDDSGSVARFFYSAKCSVGERNLGLDGFEEKETKITNMNLLGTETTIKKRLSGENPIAPMRKNNHPTVKPVKLMSYLVNLIAPPITEEYTPVVLDMFMGTGSTGIAALLNGYDFIGIEMQEDYMKIAEARINNYEEFRKYLK